MSAAATTDAARLQPAPEYGDVSYVCRHDGAEWTARGVMFEGSLDPAALEDGDRCPACGEECDQVTDWEPDTAEGYRIWCEARARSQRSRSGSPLSPPARTSD